jgi:hypothetical protein
VSWFQRCLFTLLLGLSALLAGCADPRIRPAGAHGQALIGLAHDQVRTCAGRPLRELVQSTSTLLVYYREAAMFEESFVGGKASRPGYHHGCWAMLMVEEGRVSGVEFRPVPDPDADTHECQEIFVACGS